MITCIQSLGLCANKSPAVCGDCENYSNYKHWEGELKETEYINKQLRAENAALQEKVQKLKAAFDGMEPVGYSKPDTLSEKIYHPDEFRTVCTLEYKRDNYVIPLYTKPEILP